MHSNKGWRTAQISSSEPIKQCRSDVKTVPEYHGLGPQGQCVTCRNKLPSARGLTI